MINENNFYLSNLNKYMAEFNQKGDILLEKLRKIADGKTIFKLLDEINHTALDAIASVNQNLLKLKVLDI